MMRPLHLQIVSDEATRQNFEEIVRVWREPLAGTGDPNGVVTAGPAETYKDYSTGKLWVHEDPTISNVNWAMK